MWWWSRIDAAPRGTFDAHETLVVLGIAGFTVWGVIYATRGLQRAIAPMGVTIAAEFALLAAFGALVGLACGPGALRIVAGIGFVVQIWTTLGRLRDHRGDRKGLTQTRRSYAESIDRMNRDYGLADWLTAQAMRASALLIVAIWPLRIVVAGVGIIVLLTGCRAAWAAQSGSRTEEPA